jgi:hypothetical protein
MEINKGFFEFIQLVFMHKIYTQILDYINIPFQCSRCHLYGHVLKDFSKPFTKNQWIKKSNLMRHVVEEW